MNQTQLELFPAAPGTKRSGGRGVSRARKRAALVAALVQQAQARGCTHLEASPDGMLFILPALVGRCPEATYVGLDSPTARVLLTRKRG